jgi:hypothetical protein
MKSLLWSAILCLLANSACERRAVRVDYIVPIECVKKAELLGCSDRDSPPQCLHERITFTKGCEQQVLRK